MDDAIDYASKVENKMANILDAQTQEHLKIEISPIQGLASVIRTITAAINREKIINSTLKLRNRHLVILDILALLSIPSVALTLRLEQLDWWPRFDQALIVFVIVALAIKVPIFLRFGLYRRYWCYASVDDLARVLVAGGLSSTVLTVIFLGLQTRLARYDLALPRTVLVLDGILTCLAVGGHRFFLRGLYHWHRQSQNIVGGRRVLIVGAGEAGALVASEMWANPQLNMEPVAFVDDDLDKVGTHIKNLQVIGTSRDIPKLIDRYQIQRIIVAMPSIPLQRRREIIATCENTDVATNTLPGIYELLAGHKTVSRLPQIDINHLLRREPVEIDQAQVAAYLAGATVLVTGAGGSIGSELCRQIARFAPLEMILLGHGENSIFEIGLNLSLSFPNLSTHQVIVDVRDQERVNWVIEKHRPDVIFHAAAHKHVPFMEANIEEAITNNVLGTRNVLQAAEQYGVHRLILISTDKAVNPTSIMGATKRLAELLLMAITQRSGRAYMAVRFGNVLGSRGSVIPIFQRQIAAGGPLTVTHPDMYRYFMTIPEAAQLVLQASVLGQGGETFVLDMGQPVRILDLATDLLKLSGLKPERDIKIVYSGIRPGEKLNEELFLAREDCRRTRHPKIFVATPGSVITAEMLEQVIIELVKLVRHIQSQNATTEELRDLILKICHYVDNYQPQPRPLPLKPNAIPQSSPTIEIPIAMPLPIPS